MAGDAAIQWIKEALSLHMAGRPAEAELPLLTCRGKTLPGRVAASLLRAVGLPELITDTPEEYESKALMLATDRALLQFYRDHLSRDPARTMYQIEAAYEEMMARCNKNLSPTSFQVPDRPNPLMDHR